MMRFAVLLLSYLATTHGLQATRRAVTSLPGFGAPPSKHYTGFIPVDEKSGSMLFYYLVESAGAPSTDPLLWWMNGGPGASSLAGFLGENGPLLLSADSENLFVNPYAWNRNANMLFVEFAPGIGYSYCSNSANASATCQQESGECSPCEASDHSVAAQNVVALEALLIGTQGQPALFPEFKGRELFLTGESYAGVYIPTLAIQLLRKYPDDTIVNLKGLWVTDPCIDNQAQFGWLDIGVEFAARKNLISLKLHRILVDECTTGRTRVGDRIRELDSPKCVKAWRLYDIATAGIGNAVHPEEIPGLPMYVDPLNAYGFAGGPDTQGYFNRADVRTALGAVAGSDTPNKVYHMEIGNNGYPQYELNYAACNDQATDNMTSMIQVYHDIFAEAKKGNTLRRVIISSGNIDPVVNEEGTEAAVEMLAFAEKPGGERRPWFYNASATSAATMGVKPPAWGARLTQTGAGMQIGGYVVDYETNTDAAFSFVTMRGSGHMVPAYAPHAVLELISRSLFDTKDISLPLPASWDTASDAEFYARGGKESGVFAQWAVAAMQGRPGL